MSEDRITTRMLFCYASHDEKLFFQLKAHLMELQRQEIITIQSDRDIVAGTVWKQEISEKLNNADIIVLLISPDFMASEDCYNIEMKRALERYECEHDDQQASVAPTDK